MRYLGHAAAAQTRQDVHQVLLNRHTPPAARLNHGQYCSHFGASLRAAHVQPVLAPERNGSHRVFRQVVRQLHFTLRGVFATQGQSLIGSRMLVPRRWAHARRKEMISRQAFGFRNFENYRKRVKVLCG
jgi:hypothetical protein